MKLSQITPANSARFLFIDPATSEPVSTDDGKQMFVEVYSANSPEFIKAALAKSRADLDVLKKHDGKTYDELDSKTQDALKANQRQLWCDVTIEMLYQTGDKPSTNKSKFYSDESLSYWHLQIDRFVANTSNFIKAQKKV